MAGATRAAKRSSGSVPQLTTLLIIMVILLALAAVALTVGIVEM